MFEHENVTTPSPDVNTLAASSAAQDAPAVSSPASDAQPASSTGNDGKPKEPVSFADRISSAIDAVTKRKSAEASSPAEKTEQKQEQLTQNEKPKEGSEEQDGEDEKSAGEFKDHPVFKKIIAERKTARAERDKALKEVEAYKADAQQYKTVDTFLKTNGVSYKDAGDALKLAALARTNPAEFYKKLTELAGQWGQQLGEVLPPDLQKQVDEGLISEEMAKELARTKGQVALTQEQLARREEQIRANDSTAEMQYREQMVNSWVSQAAKTDPAIEKKMPLISSRLSEILVKEGNPKDVNDAWARLNRAYTDVNNYLKTLQPQKPLTPAAPQSTGTPKSGIAAPTNYNEAWEAAFSKIGAR